MTTSVVWNFSSVLVGKANAWLAANPEVVVVTCETLETRSDDADDAVDTTLSESEENWDRPMYCHRSLRYEPGSNSRTQPAQIEQIFT